ncbi:hypothetical protein [Flavobacterium pisciphilum]|jgi:hypothetical protein|nr:hypothetical protein [Flavobacterium sp. F-65]
MYILVQANDVKEAYDNTIVIMENAMGIYTIPDFIGAEAEQ